jgi:hypothetical protein
MLKTSSRRSFLRQATILCALPGMAAAPSRSLQQRLLTAFESLEIADTHEHFFDEPDRLAQHTDFFALMAQSYTQADLASAGIPPESSRLIRNEQASDIDRWRAFEPYWKYCRFTGYAQALRLAIHDLYGGKEISASTIREINEAIRARNHPGLYRYILRERARIRFCVEDDSCGGCIKIASTKSNFEFFVLARRFDKFIVPAAPSDIRSLEQLTGVSITTLEGLKQAVEKNFRQNLSEGMTVVKIALAYFRELLFQEVDKADAERDFNALMRGQRPLPEGFRTAFVRPFGRLEDHMFHHVMKLAEAYHTPVQIHTGLFAGGGNRITNSNPTHLINTFLLYPRIKFDIFHIGYPYQQELGVLAKSFQNVHADFCWAWVVSPTASRRALNEFLDSVPVNKILGFGGDYKYPELSYAHAAMARRAVAGVLAAKVENAFCTEHEALDIGRMLLYENAAHLFSWTRS